MNGRLVYLDAGRGVAALIVLIHHVMVFQGEEIALYLGDDSLLIDVLNVVSDQNFQAVMFFFFISGWCIFLSMRGVTDAEGRISWQLYLWHRARRILPIFWIALLWSYLLTAFYGMPDVDRSMTTLAGNLLFLQTATITHGTWVVPFAGNDPLWSLSYEIWYYLALPAIFGAITLGVPPQWRRIEIGLLVSVALGVLAIGLNRIIPNPFLIFATLWPVWVAGYLFGLSLSRGDRERHKASAVLVALLLLLWGLANVIPSDTLAALRNGYAVALSVVAVVALSKLPLVAMGLQSLPVESAARGLAYIGLGSYTIYILHYPLLIFLSTNRVNLAWVCTTVLVLVLLAPLIENWLRIRVSSLSLFRRSVSA